MPHVTQVSDTGGYPYAHDSPPRRRSFSSPRPAGRRRGRDRAARGQRTGLQLRRASTYERFGDVYVFERNAKLFGCATDVGRAYKLTAPSKGVKLFGSGDWVAYAARGSVRALNVSTGRTHRAAQPATAIVVNADGTLAWISGGQLNTKTKSGATRSIGSGADANFLTLELEGCAVTWRVNGEQRSSSIACANP